MLKEIEFLGRRIAVDAVSDATSNWFSEYWFAPMRAASLALAFNRVDHTITVVESAEHVPASVATCDNAHAGLFGSRHFTTDQDEFWIIESADPNPSAVHVRLGDRRADITLYGVAFDGWFGLQAALSECLGATGLVLLHAAAIRNASSTVLLVGPSGRGKSTTLLRAVMGGWQPIAEDGVWLDIPTLHGVGADAFLRVLPSGLDLLRLARPGLDPGPLVGPKYEVPFAVVGEVVPHSEVTEIALLERSESTTPEWVPMATARTVMALYQSSGIPHTQRVGRLYGGWFGDVAERVQASVLRLGARDVPIGDHRG